MTLLFLTEFFPNDWESSFSGGVESYNFHLIQELSKQNKVIVICRRGFDQTEYNSYPFGPNIEVIRVGSTSNIDTSLLTLWERLFFVVGSILIGMKLSFDIVQGTNFVTYIPSYLIGFIKRKPQIAWYPDVFIGRWIKLVGLGSGIIGEVLERLAVRLPWTKIVALSQSTKERLIKVGVSTDRIEVIYAGVNVNDFKIKAKIKKNPKLICTISRLVNYKRVDLLIKALKILRESDIKASLLIIGKGPEESRLKSLSRRLKVYNHIVWKSDLSRENLAKSIRSSEVFCLPSEVEGFGMVVIEAAVCEVPYVVSDIRTLKEITHNGMGGLIFKSGNEADLAEKLGLLLENREKAKKLSIEAHKLVMKYSWRKVSDQFVNLYEETSR